MIFSFEMGYTRYMLILFDVRLRQYMRAEEVCGSAERFSGYGIIMVFSCWPFVLIVAQLMN